LAVPVFRDTTIRRLEAPVQNAGFGRRRQATGHASHQLADVAPARRLPLNPVLQRPAVDKLGYQILPALEFAYVVYRQNVRMIERRCHLRLALESPPGSRVL